MKMRRDFFAGLAAGSAMTLAALSSDAAVFTIPNGDLAALVGAINSANSNGEDDAINLAAGGTYSLFGATQGSNGLPMILPDGNHKLTINGNGASIMRVVSEEFRVLQIANGGTLVLNATRIVNGAARGTTFGAAGAAGGPGQGGAVANFGSVTLNACTLSGNQALGGFGRDSNTANGGAGGEAQGGGLFNAAGATAAVNNCTLAGNSARGGSGGANTGGPVNIELFGGDGGAAFGALYNEGTITVSATTVSLNKGTGGAGGAGRTPSSNGFPGRGTGGLMAAAGTSTVGNTISAGNFADGAGGTDVEGAFTSGGYNLIGNGAKATGFNAAGDQVGPSDAPLDARLGALTDNGGPTPTMALLAGSPALDKGAAFGLATDQRGIARPFDQPSIAAAAGGDQSDIGAFEANDVSQAGASFVVTTADDHTDGVCGVDCTLREAIDTSNAVAGDNIVSFAAAARGTINLRRALPSLSSNIDVQGPGAGTLTVRRDTGGDYRVFFVTQANNTAPPIVRLQGLTVSNGKATFGGGILNEDGKVTVDQCVITGNTASSAGGGIATVGTRSGVATTMTITNCLITGNSTTNDAGGGISNRFAFANTTTTLTVRDSTVSGNSGKQGAGISNTGSGSTAQLSNCTVTENTGIGTNAAGGGIFNSGTMSVINCTLSRNSAVMTGGRGGGFYNAAGTLLVRNNTLDRNAATSGGGIYNFSGVTTTGNTILQAGASGGTIAVEGACCTQITSEGYNISSDAALGDATTAPGGALNGVNDTRNTDPKLDPNGFQDHGGPTLTIALQSDSPAIDTGNDAKAPPADQRGAGRVGISDIGAFEFGGALPTPTPSPTPTSTATPVPTATPTPNRFANISTRLRVETGDNVLIGGFIVTGSMQKRMIVRALGPSLPVDDKLANPFLELYDGNAQLIASNDNWQEAPNAQEIIDSTIAPSNEFESAILQNVALGAYTAVVRDVADGEGVGLVEVYDLGSNQDSKLANIATRGRVLTGDNVMIGGLIITGSSPQKVIVRAIGPSLGIASQLEDPLLELFDGDGNPIASNNNWKDTQQTEIEATTIPPADDFESAIVTFLAPTAYTAIVRGVNDTTGVALVEVYALQP